MHNPMSNFCRHAKQTTYIQNRTFTKIYDSFTQHNDTTFKRQVVLLLVLQVKWNYD